MMEFVHALYEWAYEGNPSYLMEDHIIALLVLIALALVLFGYFLGRMHSQATMEAKRRAAQRNRHSMNPISIVEPVEAREAVATSESLKSDAPPTSPSVKYSSNDMLLQLRQAIKTDKERKRLKKMGDKDLKKLKKEKDKNLKTLKKMSHDV